jgi:hypothetical protein
METRCEFHSSVTVYVPDCLELISWVYVNYWGYSTLFGWFLVIWGFCFNLRNAVLSNRVERLYMLGKKGFWRNQFWPISGHNPGFCPEKLRKRNVKHQMQYPETWPVSNLIILDLSLGSLPHHQPDRLRTVVGSDDGHADANPINLLVHFSSGRFKCHVLWTYTASHFALWLKHRFCSKLSRTTWDVCLEKLPYGSVISHVAYSSCSFISNIEIITVGS